MLALPLVPYRAPQAVLKVMSDSDTYIPTAPSARSCSQTRDTPHLTGLLLSDTSVGDSQHTRCCAPARRIHASRRRFASAGDELPPQNSPSGRGQSVGRSLVGGTKPIVPGDG